MENQAVLLEAMRRFTSPGFQALWENLSQAGKDPESVLCVVQYSRRYETTLRKAL